MHNEPAAEEPAAIVQHGGLPRRRGAHGFITYDVYKSVLHRRGAGRVFPFRVPHAHTRAYRLTQLVNEPVEVACPYLCLEKLLLECKLNGVRRSVDARDIYLAPVHKPHALLTMYYPHPSRLARSSMPKQNCSHGVNVVCNGSPSRIRIVRRISFGITTRPKSSILRTIPVAFIYISPLAQIVFRDIVCSFWEFIQWRDECRNRRIS